MSMVAISDNIRFCLLTLWRRTKKMHWRPVCSDGVYGGIGCVAAKVRRGVERTPRIGGISHGATMHTKDGLWCKVRKREGVH